MKVGQKLYSVWGCEGYRVSLKTWVVSSIKRSPRRHMWRPTTPNHGPVVVYLRMNGGKSKWERGLFMLEDWPSKVRGYHATPRNTTCRVSGSRESIAERRQVPRERNQEGDGPDPNNQTQERVKDAPIKRHHRDKAQQEVGRSSK